MDNRPEHEGEKCKASQLIMDMGGPEGIAKRLHTSTEVSNHKVNLLSVI